MTDWLLACAHCDWYIEVNNRGARGNDPGAGVEAARLMEAHVQRVHKAREACEAREAIEGTP